MHDHTRFNDGWEGTPADAYTSAFTGGATSWLPPITRMKVAGFHVPALTRAE